MQRILGVCTSILLLISVDASAFDGHRKGFVLGGGAGYAPYAHWSSDAADWTFKPLVDETSGAFAAQLLAGYAWDDHNVLAAELNWTWYESDIGEIYGDEVNLYRIFIGPAWYHYYGSRGHSLFTSIGIGRYGFGQPGTIGMLRGWAYLIGGGYEFTKQVQVDLTLVGGHAGPCCDTDADLDVGTVNVSFPLTVIAY